MRAFLRQNLPWLGLVALAAVLRFFQLGSQSLWSDEGLSLFQASHSFAAIWADLKQDVHPPLYYWILHYWVQAFYQSEFGLRASSALLGVATVALALGIYRRFTRPGAAFIAGLGLAVSASHNALSQELRSHGAVCALATLSAYCLLRWLDDPCPPRWAAPAWALSALSLAHVNFFGLLMLPVHLGMGATGRPERRRGFLLLYALVALATLPFLLYIRPYLAVQAQREGWAVPSPEGIAPIRRLTHFLTLYFDYPEPHLALDAEGALNWALFVSVLAVVGWGLHCLRRQGQARGAAWLGIWLILPVLEVRVLAWAGVDLMVFKYFAMVLPALCGLLGAGFEALLASSEEDSLAAGLRRIGAGVLLLGWLGLNLVAWGYRQFDDRFSNPDWRRVASLLNQNCQPGDLIVLQPGMQWLALSYYYSTNVKPILVDTEEGWPALEAALPTAHRVFLCLSPAYPQVAQVGLAARLGQRLKLLSHIESHKAHPASDVEIYVFEN